MTMHDTSTLRISCHFLGLVTDPINWLPVLHGRNNRFTDDRAFRMPALKNESGVSTIINENTNPELFQNSQNLVELVQFRIFSKTCLHCTHCRVY